MSEYIDHEIVAGMKTLAYVALTTALSALIAVSLFIVAGIVAIMKFIG